MDKPTEKTTRTRRKTKPNEPAAIARRIVDIASDKQASDIVLLDVREIAGFADYLVLMSAGSERQIGALAADVLGDMKRDGVTLHHQEGNADSGWVLLDYADVVVHIFSEEQREFYGLEQVWRQGKQVVRLQ